MGGFSHLSEKAKNAFMGVVSKINPLSDQNTKKWRKVAGIVVIRDIGDEKEFLLLKKPRKSNTWQFPQGGVDAGETLLEAAQRELKEEAGDVDVHVQPKVQKVYKYLFPEDFKRHHGEFAGAAVHFFKAEWIEGEVQPDGKEIIDFAWVKAYDVPNYVEKSYFKAIKSLLK